MQQFASRDLMVSALPEQAGETWGDEEQACGNCTDCTNNTKTERPKPKPKPKPNWKSAGEEELLALRDQLSDVLG